jgi:hypothetical protein
MGLLLIKDFVDKPAGAPMPVSGAVRHNPIGSDRLRAGFRLFVLTGFLDANRLLRPKTL